MRPSASQYVLVIGISQSGASPDIVAVVAAALAQGAPTVAITNDPGSALEEAADRTIDLGAGPERAIAATQTYTTELLAIALLSAALAGVPGDRAALAAIPETLARALELEPEIERTGRTGRTGRWSSHAASNMPQLGSRPSSSRSLPASSPIRTRRPISSTAH